MVVTSILFCSNFLGLVLNWWSLSECKMPYRKSVTDQHGLKIRDQEYVTAKTVAALVFEVGSEIRQLGLTHTDACGSETYFF